MIRQRPPPRTIAGPGTSRISARDDEKIGPLHGRSPEAHITSHSDNFANGWFPLATAAIRRSLLPPICCRNHAQAIRNGKKSVLAHLGG